jgi:hypothetical protein
MKVGATAENPLEQAALAAGIVHTPLRELIVFVAVTHNAPWCCHLLLTLPPISGPRQPGFVTELHRSSGEEASLVFRVEVRIGLAQTGKPTRGKFSHLLAARFKLHEYSRLDRHDMVVADATRFSQSQITPACFGGAVPVRTEVASLIPNEGLSLQYGKGRGEACLARRLPTHLQLLARRRYHLVCV